MAYLLYAISALQRLPLLEIRNVLLVVVAVLGLVAVLFRVAAAVLDYQRLRRAEALQKRLHQAAIAFNKEDIRDSLKNYIEPDCAQTDPSNQTDLRLVADVREPVMRAVERFVLHGGERRYILLLADSGMGKTTFCLNFFSRQIRKGQSCVIVPLGRPEALTHIKGVENPSETILLLDAFDEDVEAIEDSGRRLLKLMEAVSRFKSVIVTCRSQFFLNDASIPTETGVAVIRPRRGGERGSYKFFKLYLLPFSESQVDRYVSTTYPMWEIGAFAKRKSARSLIADIPELTVRPMLLALIPGLIRSKKKLVELFELYQFMVEQWLERESRWINSKVLLSVSKKIAVHMVTSKARSNRDRITVEVLRQIAEESGELIENWQHLTARSLLNRDSEGRFKFAHRSVMEFLFVLAAIEGDERCFQVWWTDMMTELFVSWGATSAGRANIKRAREVLSLDLEMIGLAPLSTPLPTPRVLGGNALLKVNLPASVSATRWRRIPSEWRIGSLRLTSDQDVWWLRDFAYDLFWRVADHRHQPDAGLYRLNYAEVSKTEQDGMRLPSIEEFISLSEAEQILEVEILEPDEYYWLGDQLGRGKYIVARIGADVTPDELLRVVGKLDIASRTGEPLWLYEVAMRVRSKGTGAPFAAMSVLVRDGESERVRHLRSKQIASKRAKAVRSPADVDL